MLEICTHFNISHYVQSRRLFFDLHSSLIFLNNQVDSFITHTTAVAYHLGADPVKLKKKLPYNYYTRLWLCWVHTEKQFDGRSTWPSTDQRATIYIVFSIFSDEKMLYALVRIKLSSNTVLCLSFLGFINDTMFSIVRVGGDVMLLHNKISEFLGPF